MKATHIFATVVAILIVSMSGHTYAESRKTDASVSGHVIDAKTGEHLPYVTVMIGGTQIGIQTSSSGHYSIRNLPLGKHEIIATSIGYKDASVTLEFKAGQSYEANFSLERENLSLDGVVVSASGFVGRDGSEVQCGSPCGRCRCDIPLFRSRKIKRLCPFFAREL